ncbi:MAG: DUF1329 domain-containing protein, partial [Candidatus Binatia bacterium]
GKAGVRAMMPCDADWEKRPVWVVEELPTGYSQYAYSKRLIYLDKDFYSMSFTEMFDQGGELWRIWWNIFNYSKKPYEGYPTKPLPGGKYNYEDEWPFTPHGMGADLQTIHSTKWDAPSGYTKPTEWTNEWYFNEDVAINKEPAYTVNFLTQSGR